MFPCTVAQLLQIIAGNAVDDCGRDGTAVTGVSIDSRKIQPGDVFFALPGTKYHGVLYADEAIERGASCVVTDHASVGSLPDHPKVVRFRSADTIENDSRMIRVPDVLQALQKLAEWNRRQSSALIIGITGSVGKTTARQMIASVLRTQFCGVQSPQNFNNELGVPLSLLQLNPEHEFAVLEMGASRPGDIRWLAQLAKPEIGLITKVAPTHLESFESLSAIQSTKQELAQAIGSGGTVLLNADDSLVCSMKSSTSAEVILFGLAEDADVQVSDVSIHEGICTVEIGDKLYQFAGPRHLASLAAAAVAVGQLVGVCDSNIRMGLASFQLDAGRGRVVQRSPWIVVDDSYNASPASVAAAIESLSDWTNAKHRVLVLGDMLELGNDTAKAHFEVGRALAASTVDHTLVFGEFASSVVEGARSAGVSVNRISLFSDLSTLQVILDCLLTPGDIVLVKGSRAMAMERVVQWLDKQSQHIPMRFAA